MRAEEAREITDEHVYTERQEELKKLDPLFEKMIEAAKNKQYSLDLPIEEAKNLSKVQFDILRESGYVIINNGDGGSPEDSITIRW